MRAGAVNTPWLFVSIVRLMPLDSLETTTVAPGTAAFEGSWTTPEILPWPDCPKALATKIHDATTRRTKLFRMQTPSESAEINTTRSIERVRVLPTSAANYNQITEFRRASIA